MAVTASLVPGADAAPVDAYIVLQIPSGEYFSLRLGAGFVPGVRALAGAVVPFPAEAIVAQYAFTGAEPAGRYVWYSALTRPGTLELVSELQQAEFTVGADSTAQARLTLAQAIAAEDADTAYRVLGQTLGSHEVLSTMTSSARLNVAQALRTCSIVKTGASYRICADPTGGYRFVLVLDQTGAWRVTAW